MQKFKMNWGRAALVSLPFFAITIFWQAYDYIIPLILTRHFHVSTMGYSIIMSIDNVVALLFLPLFGAISDKINGKMGRRTPLVLWGTLGGIFGLVAMNMADGLQLEYSATVMSTGAFLFFLAGLLVAVFSMSLYRAPATALIADCFIRPLRTKANAMLNLLGGLAGVTFALLGKALITRGLSLTISFIILAMVVSTAIFLILFRENKTVEKVQQEIKDLGIGDKNTVVGDTTVTKLARPELKSLMAILGVVVLMYMGYNAFSTHYSNYLTKYLMQDASWTTPLLTRILLVLIFTFPAAAIASKIGRKKAALIGLVIAGVSYLGLATVTAANINTIYIWFILFSFGFPLVAVNTGPMVLELAKDRDSGRYMGYYYIAATIAQIITPTLASIFIETLGLGYGAISYYAAAFFALAAVCSLWIKHGDVKPTMKDAIEQASEND